MWLSLSVTCDRSVIISPDPPVSSTNKTDRHDITDILLKVALNTINLTNQPTFWYINHQKIIGEKTFMLQYILYHSKAKISFVEVWCTYCKPTFYSLDCDWFSRFRAVQCYWQWNVNTHGAYLSFTWRKRLFFIMFRIMKQSELVAI